MKNRQTLSGESLSSSAMANHLGQIESCIQPRSMKVWRALIDSLALFFQIIYQVISQFLSNLVFPQSILSGSDSPSFKSLPLVEFSRPPPDFSLDIRFNRIYDQRFNKLTVVLDLDETLICSYERSSLTSVVRNQAIRAGLNRFELEFRSSNKECEGKSRVSHITVFERPGLHEFLKQISEFANLVLFTAGVEGYARPIIDKIDVEKRFCICLYRSSTVNTEFRHRVKDLSFVSRDLRRIVIVDNEPFSFLLQPLNGIPCVPFSAKQPYDDQLLATVLPLLRHLSVQNDVRPVLENRFHMADWFQMHGVRTCIR